MGDTSTEPTTARQAHLRSTGRVARAATKLHAAHVALDRAQRAFASALGDARETSAALRANRS